MFIILIQDQSIYIGVITLKFYWSWYYYHELLLKWIHVFFISNQNFENRLGHANGKSLFRLSMLALCLFIKILLGVCLRKRLDQARNMIILEKLLYKMCCCCDTDYNIIGHLASSERHLFCCIFDESEGKCFAIINRKNHSQYGKIHATQKNA